MAWLFIIAGLFIIGFAFYVSRASRKKGLAAEDKALHYQDEAQPGGLVGNLFNRKKLESGAKLQEAANIASTASVAGVALQTENVKAQAELEAANKDKEHLGTRIERTQKLEAEDHEVHLLERGSKKQDIQLRQMLVKEAQERGVSLETLNRILETRELNDLEIEKLRKETYVKLEAGFIYQLREYQKLMMLRKQLDDLYLEIDQIQKSAVSDYVKQMQIDERKEDIETLREDRRERRQRLLQALNGPALPGGDPDAEP
jgi:hypothetical protein